MDISTFPAIRPAPPLVESAFCQRLEMAGRILEYPDHYVWCCSPIDGADGRIHVFYSRWPQETGFQGWLSDCEVAHAVADQPEGPYETVDVALAGRGPGYWDGGSIHNPTIHRVGDQYALFYMGACHAKGVPRDDLLRSKAVGVALSSSLDGPWRRLDKPLIAHGPAGAWDDILASNPAFLHHPDGNFWLYYKSMDEASVRRDPHGNRKYGLAVATSLEGPYVKCGRNPLVDMSVFGARAEIEDAYVWFEGGTFRMIARDMGVFGESYGLYLESADGLSWGEPQIAYLPSPSYLQEPPNNLPRKERFERPQLLLRHGKPTHLFVSFRGGRHGLSTAAVLRIRDQA